MAGRLRLMVREGEDGHAVTCKEGQPAAAVQGTGVPPCAGKPLTCANMMQQSLLPSR